MQITLIFQAPAGEVFGDAINLTESQIGLIPNVGDHVVLTGQPRKVAARFFSLHPENTRINFRVENVPL